MLHYITYYVLCACLQLTPNIVISVVRLVFLSYYHIHK